MGLGNGSTKESTMITIVGGKWTRRVPEGTEGATKRTNKLGAEVSELSYDHVDGQLIGGAFNTSEYGTDLILPIQDGDVYELHIPADSDYFRTFAKLCEGLDVSKPVFLGLGVPDDGFPYLYVQQEGKTLKSNYTKDNPNGMPSWEKKEEMGKVKWDKTAQNNFCYNLVVDFLANVEDSVVAITEQPTSDAPAVPAGEGLSDSVPF